MALVYDVAVVDRFFALLAGASTYRAPLATVEEDLPGPVLTVTPGIGFDPFGDEITFSGPMSDDVRDDLLAAADALVLGDVDVIDTQAALDDYIAGLQAAINALHAAAGADIAGLHADHPALGPVLDTAIAATGPAAQAAVVLDGILPTLRTRLKTTGLRTALATMLRTDEGTVAALASATDVLDDLLAIDAAVAFDGDGTFEVVVDPPATDDYLLYVLAPAGTQVALTVDGAVAIPNAAVGAGGEIAATDAAALVVGSPVAIELTISGLPAGATATLRWRTNGMAKSAIPAARLIGGAVAATAASSLLRVRKQVLLTAHLALTPREIAFFAAECPDTDGILDDLPVDGPPPAAGVPAVWSKLSALLSFSALKRDTEPDADTWVDVLETGALGEATGQQRVATIGSWRPADVADAVTLFGAAGDALRSVATLLAVRRLADHAATTGQTVADLITWSVPDPDAALVDAVRQHVRATLDATTWRETMKSVNDELRNRRRDALVAYILAHDPPTPAIDTPDELYEHFLVDVADGRLPADVAHPSGAVDRAAVRHPLPDEPGIGGLAGLDPPGPLGLDEAVPGVGGQPQGLPVAGELARARAARRQVAVLPRARVRAAQVGHHRPSWPRTPTSPTSRSSTTSPASRSSAATSSRASPSKADDDILHVIGRTNGKTRQYWYRRYEYRTYWTPWEKVTLNIEGDLVLPTMWRNQLYLFWVTAVEKPHGGNQDKSSGDLASQTWAPRSRTDVELTLNWGELLPGQVELTEVDRTCASRCGCATCRRTTRRACCCSPAR